MIHATAVIHDGAHLGAGVKVGPYAVIGPQVVLEAGVTVAPHAVVEGNTTVGEATRIHSFAAIGHPPQDLGYAGEDTRVEIGKRCLIREYVSINRGTVKGGGVTRVGDECMIMAYSHVAHDCQVGDQVVMANCATLAGHVEIGSHAVIGGLTAIHQHARIGGYAFIGGASAVSMDVIPFASAAGNRTRITGINIVGMRRHGFSPEVIKAVREANRLIFRASLRLEEAVQEIENQFPDVEPVKLVLDFIKSSKRGLCR